MTSPRVTGVRSVELGVRNLNQSADFYKKVWGLDEVAANGDAMYLRGTGRDHHLLALREQGKASLLAVDFATADRHAVDALYAKTKGYGVKMFGEPAPRTVIEGGGYGFKFNTPDGLPIRISCEIGQHEDTVVDKSRPSKIAHVVPNSAKTDEQITFFTDVLGFKLTDSSRMMEFLRCTSDHHSMAIFRNNGPSLNHIAYDVPDIDGLMRGSGRLKQNGFNVEWGIGRHGPGNNVFSYFIEPNGFVTEYTTEVEQIDEATHIAQDAEFWDKLPQKPDRWGLAGMPSNRMQQAMSGALYQAEGERCEDVIARKLG
jgi:catechol 2,3-dioxygenase-like lactoylglutathione lyase family enzyme